jgi:hypothetical protein
MQQCGDDEEFLRELLGDLRAETEAQLAAIRATIQVRFVSPPLPPILLLLLRVQCRRARRVVNVGNGVSLSFLLTTTLLSLLLPPASQSPQDAPYHRIARAAHVVKGASANLMCHQLRSAATALEQAAHLAHESGGAASPPDVQAAVQARFADMERAAARYGAFLQSIGV